MILLDTSIWIEFLNKNQKYFPKVSELLLENSIITTDFIFGQLIQGVRNNFELNTILDFYDNLPKSIISDVFTHAGLLSHKKQFIQKGIGLIDSAIIFTCYEKNYQLWTLDKKIIKNINNDFLYEFTLEPTSNAAKK